MSSAGQGRAMIVNVKQPSEWVECLFNPKEYTVAKQNSWQTDAKAGHNVPQLNFGGGQPATLQMELFFDTYHKARSGAPAKDVRKEYTDKLWNMMAVDRRNENPKTKKAEPPYVRFQWGSAWSFTAVITSISQKFTMFLADGTPVRATLTVSFQQAQDETEKPKQNPTSGGTGGERVWTVTAGDTLGWIAHREYGDSSRWRVIADANHLTELRRLTPGTVLVIPNG